jgi:hypothetical protein
MSQMWNSLADRPDPEKPGLVSILQGKKTNKNWRLFDLARQLCRGHGHTNKRRRGTRNARDREVRTPRLREPRT